MVFDRYIPFHPIHTRVYIKGKRKSFDPLTRLQYFSLCELSQKQYESREISNSVYLLKSNLRFDRSLKTGLIEFNARLLEIRAEKNLETYSSYLSVSAMGTDGWSRVFIRVWDRWRANFFSFSRFPEIFDRSLKKRTKLFYVRRIRLVNGKSLLVGEKNFAIERERELDENRKKYDRSGNWDGYYDVTIAKEMRSESN